MKTTIKQGITWTYLPGQSYAAKYKGWDITVRRFSKNWRLFVRNRGGGSLTFNRQFYSTIDEARRVGIKSVDSWDE